jgi:transcriptional regulator with XRE-family HTH domain
MFDISGVKERIREVRVERGVSRWELADTLNVSYNAISKWESHKGIYSKTVPSIDHLMELCEVLETTPNYILLGKE